MPPVVSIVGWSGSGKTTFLEKLISELKMMGLKVGVIKHHTHGFEMDKPGKDSWRHKQAGATTTIISSPQKIGMVMDVDHDFTPDELIPFFPNVDVVLTEGYKRGDKPKVEIFRAEVHDKPFCLDDGNLIALVTDDDPESDVERFSLNDSRGLAVFLTKYLRLAKK